MYCVILKVNAWQYSKSNFVMQETMKENYMVHFSFIENIFYSDLLRILADFVRKYDHVDLANIVNVTSPMIKCFSV